MKQNRKKPPFFAKLLMLLSDRKEHEIRAIRQLELCSSKTLYDAIYLKLAYVITFLRGIGVQIQEKFLTN
jgi:hypothetical protein